MEEDDLVDVELRFVKRSVPINGRISQEVRVLQMRRVRYRENKRDHLTEWHDVPEVEDDKQ